MQCSLIVWLNICRDRAVVAIRPICLQREKLAAKVVVVVAAKEKVLMEIVNHQVVANRPKEAQL